MVIDVALVPAEIQGNQQLSRYAVVVIDVLRATSTIVTALHAGATAVVPVVDAEEASRLAEALGGSAILGGERGGVALPGFHVGNSPLEYTAERVNERVVVLTTTNGTHALRMVHGAAAVATGAFLNAAAVVRWAVAQLEVGRELLLVCAGSLGRFSWEDACFAGLVVERVRLQVGDRLQVTDGARAAEQAWLATGKSPVAAIEMSCHGAGLDRLGFGQDLTYCSQLSTIDALPELWEGRLLLKES